MNKRIKELAEQAGMNIVDDKFSTYGKFAEKFAELIVKECAEIAHCNFHVDGVTLGNIMKERFGVEE
jgi:hypothetical protein